MTSIKAIIESAEKKCLSRGVRLTKKRKKILRCLVQQGKALSAYEVVDYCKKVYDESMPPTSVYRILNFLQENLLAHKLQIENKYIACAHILCDHDHEVPQFLICRNCRKVKEVTINNFLIEGIQKAVLASNFHLVTPQLEIDCLCGDCERLKLVQ